MAEVKTEEEAVAGGFRMEFDVGTIKHLGLQMYSTLPPVIGELVANAWDAEAESVDVTVPEGVLDEAADIGVRDDGRGMSDGDVRGAYLIVGRDRRKEEGSDRTAGEKNRPLMGRKGIGKFAGFGIAKEVEVETARDGEVSRFAMNFDDLEEAASRREISFPPLPPTGQVDRGTKVTLRKITRFRTRSIDVSALRRALARRFAVIGPEHGFEVAVNGKPISPDERNLKQLLETDDGGRKYLWEYEDVEVNEGTGWRVSGWIGALNRTTTLPEGVDRGIVIMARGKLVQEPFFFQANVGQQFALAYIIGELHTEFVDADEDTVGTTRNSLVWDSDRNAALLAWGKAQLEKISREWSGKRKADNEAKLRKNPAYQKFLAAAKDAENRRAVKIADKLVRQVISQNLVGDEEGQDAIIGLCIDYLEFDAFWELAEEVADAGVADTERLMRLFREWELVEAKEMARVTGGRIKTITKLQELIDTNALEVPTLHRFLKEFPWVLDPRWNLVADETRYSDLLREHFPDDGEPEEDRRIDFLCVREGTQVVVVEIKRPKAKASTKQLTQIKDYVHFVRDLVSKTTDPDLKDKEVVGYLLCGDLVDTWQVRQEIKTLEASRIFVRLYGDLLGMVRNSHREFLEKYERLHEARTEEAVGPVGA